MFSRIVNMFNKKSGYEAEFFEAIRRTKKWNLTVPPFKSETRAYITPEIIEDFRGLVQKILGQYQPEDVSQKRFQITGMMRSHLEDLLKTPLTITLGYVDYNKTSMFYTPIEELKSLLNGGPYFGFMSLHAWLTTPNYEIIDLTFGTTYSVINNDPEPFGALFCQHYSKFNEGMTYRPQLVGDAYLRKIGGLSNIFQSDN